MINGMSSRIFILSGKRLTSPINEDLWQQGWQRELSDGWQAHWSEDGTQIVFKDQLWQVLNLLTGEISDVSRPHPENEIVPPLNVQKKLEYKYGDHYKVVSNSPDGRLFAIIVTNEQKETSGKIFIVDTTKFDLFEVSKNSANCSQPSWSPSGQKLAFICKPMVSETELWVITLPITEEAKLISTNQEDYLDPIWSEDDQQILVGGKALIVFNLDSTQSSTIMKTSFGYFSNPSWQPQN